jgi:hypothetical protein
VTEVALDLIGRRERGYGRAMRTLSLTLALLLLVAATAFAAQPKTPAQFDGGDGHGTPVMFKLNKNGKVTKAAVAYTCKGANGIGFAQSKHPRGHVKSNGSLVIRYRFKDSDQKGKLRIRFDVTFPTKTTAKGSVTIKNKSCGNKSIGFTADAR